MPSLSRVFTSFITSKVSLLTKVPLIEGIAQKLQLFKQPSEIFKKSDEKKIFTISNKKNIKEMTDFLKIVDCDQEFLNALLLDFKNTAKTNYSTFILEFRLSNCWVSYFITYENYKKIELSSISYI